MGSRPTVTPLLIAHWPQALRDLLRGYGVAVRSMSIEETDTALQCPPSQGAVLIDLCGSTLAEAARLLGQIQVRQRRSRCVPLLAVPQGALGMQRLIAASPGLRAVVVDPDQPDLLVTWLLAPTDLIPATIWVGIGRPELMHEHRQLPPLVAQLPSADSLDQVARRAAIAPHQIYAILHTWCGHTPGRRLPAEQWRARLCAAISGRPLDLQAQQRPRQRPQTPDLPQLRQDLIGGVVEQQTATPCGPQLQIRPCHQQHATISLAAQADEELIAQPRWARVVEWVEQIPGAGLMLGTVGGGLCHIGQGARSRDAETHAARQ